MEIAPSPNIRVTANVRHAQLKECAVCAMPKRIEINF
jgi:hypothetical protein